MSEVQKFVGFAREKFYYHNTLLCLVKSCQDKNVTVDLRNDSYVCGKVESVDGFMNISFIGAVYCDPQGNEYAFENLFIHGRNIRYVHIPENVSILNAVRNEVVKAKKEPIEKPVKKSRKAQKALKQHMQTVASLNMEDKN
ncbi:LSM domain-containing protein [Phthorimaea operculella]|nr:LSM domain-containing protein [Phthorimaea operculella]